MTGQTSGPKAAIIDKSEDILTVNNIDCSVYATCELRGVNFYEFVRDYLDGKVDSIPMPISACTR